MNKKGVSGIIAVIGIIALTVFILKAANIFGRAASLTHGSLVNTSQKASSIND